MNPLVKVIEPYRYEPWTTETQAQLKQIILSLDIPGIIDISFETDDSKITVKPLFATEEDRMWYMLKYVNTL